MFLAKPAFLLGLGRVDEHDGCIRGALTLSERKSFWQSLFDFNMCGSVIPLFPINLIVTSEEVPAFLSAPV